MTPRLMRLGPSHAVHAPAGRSSRWVRSSPIDDRLHRWIARHRRVFVLTGAGCSTESGIPDYRDDEGAWKRRPPVMIQAFRTQEAVHRRYWARSQPAGRASRPPRPNAAHRALAALEAAGTLRQLVTQNVDGLHQRAGSRAVIDLHGRLDEVVCLDCGDAHVARDLQAVIAAANPDWRAEAPIRRRTATPTSTPRSIESFAAPGCLRCGGVLKPDVVFFGENVPRRAATQAARDALTGADALLVVGSSLMVFSGFRFVRLAHEAGLPVAIVNRGRTRGDELAGAQGRNGRRHRSRPDAVAVLRSAPTAR